MTLSETKALIRHARTVMRDLRASVNSHGLHDMPSSLYVPRSDFEALEWGMGHLLKGWVYDYDANGNFIRETGRLVRMHGGFKRNDGTENLMFKGIPVRVAEPAGAIA